MMRPKTKNNSEEAEILAINALGFLAADDQDGIGHGIRNDACFANKHGDGRIVLRRPLNNIGTGGGAAA